MKTPLKTVLKNFLDHINDLDSRKKLYDDQYEVEFQELKKLTDKLKEDPSYQCSIGLKDVNRPKNRYKDIVPYDFSRVILPKHEGIPGSDFINASYVKGASGALAYIAAQGPLPNTVIDFWKMIWVCDVQVIVMACNEREAGKYKCEVYWPDPGEIKQYGNVSIELVNSSQICPDFLVRTLLVKCGSEMRDVYQFHYTTWPDHGVPDSVQPILDLVRLMRDCQASETVPIVVHCSAGCGRTGTLCAVDYVWACLRHGKLDEDFSLFQISLELRRQRIAMIQTKEQYILAHKAVAAMFEQQLRVIDCHIYENLDEDGEPLIWKEVGKDKEFEIPEFMKKLDTKENKELSLSDAKPVVENENGPDLHAAEKVKQLNTDDLSRNSSTDHNLNMKTNAIDCVDSSRRNSESSYSRNSILSQHSNEDSIPFIDEDDVTIRPNCGRAYLNMPSCDSISKLVNCFDPFVDKVSSGTDDSSPDGDPTMVNNKMKDFQSDSSCKTLDKNAKFSAFKNNKCVEERETKLTDSESNIDSTKKALFPNRESYPPSNIEKLHKNSVDIDKKSEELKNEKKIGKATVVRRPSISKLRAFFEKSGISSQRSNDGSKRVLFRNNSHHVARADSAPPSLDCMDRSSAVEKESILKMVTRKFRSSSVRTEREMQSKQFDKCLNRRSATDAVKDGLNTLTRTMSLSINKTFKSYSPAKMKPEKVEKIPSSNISQSVAGVYKPKSPDHVTGNSMWYDKASLPRAVAIVKPTGKFDTDVCAKPVVSKSPSNPQSPDENKSQEASFAYISKPVKLKDFFSSLNKKDAKDSTTLWYNESNDQIDLNLDKNNLDLTMKYDNSTNSPTKSTSKVLPFLPMVPWKKVGQKSPLNSPDSPKSSTFYTDVVAANSTNVNTSVEEVSSNLPKCPIPEEIIHLDPSKTTFWPSSSISSIIQSKNSENSNCNISACSDSKPQQSMNNELSKSVFEKQAKNVSKHLETNELSDTKSDLKINITTDTRPAIPKKTVIGKNKTFQNAPLDKVAEPQSASQHAQISENLNKNNSDKTPLNEQNFQHDTLIEKNDLYINVNIKAMKNIEQIENTLRKNPRGAIIDLTSRESYSMEEELVNAVNQLSEPALKNKEPPPSKDELQEKSKMLGIKNNSKFPGYEVIWPEQPCIPIQKSKSSSKVPLISNTKMTEKNIEMSLSNQNKTGLCHSPPLRRSVNASMALSKSQSCGNLDWSEVDDPISNLKEQANTPTKRLVNEAVVELNTLLNQLTTRTLSEDIDFDAKSKEKPADKDVHEKSNVNLEVNNIEPNDTVVDSVTLVTKSYNAGSSPREEEIVFHFPPPPRVPPPPKDESSVESFNVMKKGGCLVLNKSSDSDSTEKLVNSNTKDSKLVGGNSSSANSSESSFDEISLKKYPQPAPRKSKQASGLRRSSSYTNIIPPPDKNKGYENVFLEKYQTLSKLEIKPDFDKQNLPNKPMPNKTMSFKKSPLMSKSVKMSSNYVNIGAESRVSQTVKAEVFANKTEICENTSPSNVITDKQSFDKCKMIIDESKCDGNSIYGKICKTPDKKAQSPENCSSVNLMQNMGEVKRKPVHFKKSERAPPPPNIKPVNNEMIVKPSPTNSLIPKKLPSRKLEKAPPPPHMLQKSSSAVNIPKRNMQSSASFMNFSPVHQVEEKPKLPAVRENVLNISDATPVVNKNINPSVVPHKFVNRGLSHSQSDVSVYLALKERKIQTANQDRKILNIKSLLLNKKTKVDATNVSSSDSDSSYEKIFLTKCDQAGGKTVSEGVPKEKLEQISVKSYRKEVPVAPPRSKRRSTTEVQYTKVKAKNASHVSSTSQLLEGIESKNSKMNCSTLEEDPPAIPMKTKDAFEVPKEILNDKSKRK